MLSQRSAIGLTVLLIGLVVTVLGACSYTGILDLGLPDAVVYIGFIVTVVGLAILHMELRANDQLIRDYYAPETERKSKRRSNDR